MKTKQYNFGNCIPESVKLYNKLKRQGLNPEFVEGWVEVSEFPDLEPCREFLELYYPDMIKKLDKNILYDDYIRVLPHTWVILDNQYIDITKSQFDNYGGIIKYYESMRYVPNNNRKLSAIEITDFFDDRDFITEQNKYIRFPDEVDR